MVRSPSLLTQQHQIRFPVYRWLTIRGRKGQLTDGMTTDDNKPTFTGKAEQGSTVTIYDNGRDWFSCCDQH